MKKLIFCLVPVLFLACWKDYDKIAKEDNLSDENKAFLEACDKNDDVYSCWKIYFSYKDGEGANKNADKALAYRQKTCDTGHKLFKSFRTIEDYKEYSKQKRHKIPSADNIASFPCSFSGNHFVEREELGFKGEWKKAIKFFEKACELKGSYCDEVIGLYAKYDDKFFDKFKSSKEWQKLWLKGKMFWSSFRFYPEEREHQILLNGY